MRRLVVLFVFLLVTPAAAQEVLGTAVIGGKRVELLGDKTWRYADPANRTSGACVPIDHVLTFCGSILDWRPMNTVGTEFIRQFKHSERVYAGIIHEQIGSNDGVDQQYMRNAVIENVAMFTNVRPEEIPIYGVDSVDVDGQAAETITYGAVYNGLDIVYQNTLVNGPDYNLQFVVWSVGSGVTENAEKMNANFLSSIRLSVDN